MRSAQNSFLLRSLCCGGTTSTTLKSYKSEDSSGNSRANMRPNSGESGFISGSSVEMARKDFIRLENEELDSRHTAPNLQITVANLEKNKDLNRWYNVLPYDATRVKLLPTSRDSNSGPAIGSTNGSQSGFNDYINASRIDAPYLDNKSYILSQGPLPETIGNFWTMIWQQQVSAIVMLCRLTESGICKCARYWPATTEEDDLIHVPNAGLEVRLRDFDDQDKDFSVRNLELRHCETDYIRVITQYHYLTWPDFGVPHSTATFLKFLQTVSSKHPSSSDSPNIIHCSAGIGRSGTFILADTCLSRMKQTRKSMTRSQILDSLTRMRNMRCGLIQTWEQLRFCLQSIEDGMLDIDFSDNPEDSSASPGLTGGGTSASSNGGTRSIVCHRKRSTDTTNAVEVEELRKLSNNSSENNHEKNNFSGNNSSATSGAGAPPKRPKANC